MSGTASLISIAGVRGSPSTNNGEAKSVWQARTWAKESRGRRDSHCWELFLSSSHISPEVQQQHRGRGFRDQWTELMRLMLKSKSQCLKECTSPPEYATISCQALHVIGFLSPPQHHKVCTRVIHEVPKTFSKGESKVEVCASLSLLVLLCCHLPVILSK